MSTLRLIDRYARRYRLAKGSASFTRLDCHTCVQPIKTGTKVILESPPRRAGVVERLHPECFSGEDRQQALQRHSAEHGDSRNYQSTLHPPSPGPSWRRAPSWSRSTRGTTIRVRRSARGAQLRSAAVSPVGAGQVEDVAVVADGHMFCEADEVGLGLRQGRLRATHRSTVRWLTPMPSLWRDALEVRLGRGSSI